MNRLSKVIHRKKSDALFVLIICFGLFLNSAPALAWPWSESAAEKQMKMDASAAYKRLTSDCFNISGYSAIKSVGKSRSNERLGAINDFYVPFVQKLCLKGANGALLENPYYGINLAKLNDAKYPSYDYELLQSVLYNLDFGFSPFTSAGTICGDGWLSGSVGQGTCSWHGGYAKPRGSEINITEFRDLEAPKADSFSKVSSMGFHWQNGGTWTQMKTPVSKIASGTKGFNCVTSPGFTQNCFHQPHFSFNFCSSNQAGKVQLLVGKDWMNAWSETGFKILNNCHKDTPYFFEVNGTSVLSGSLRVLFSDGSDIGFKVSAAVI